MTEGWVGVEGCPVLELGRQSGERKAAPSGPSASAGTGNTVTLPALAGRRGYPDTGTAARFFMQFGGEEDNLIEPVQKQTSVQVINDNCLEAMRRMPDACIDSIVTDPPAGINFMNKAFDSDRGGRDQWIAWLEEIMAEALRVVKPGAHALVWALPRTSHWTATALENAGWEVRDRISHVFGSGFPKSANVEKLLTKAQGQKRRAHGMVPLENPQSARMHSGIGSAMKPSNEDWWLVRKPFKGSISSNILKHGEWLEDGTVYKVGTGGLNIDQSRVGLNGEKNPTGSGKWSSSKYAQDEWTTDNDKRHGGPTPNTGRFPANLLLSHVPGPNGCVRVGSRRVKGTQEAPQTGKRAMDGWGMNGNGKKPGYADPDGLEEVPEYICADSCPVRALDEQGKSAGVHAAGNKKSTVNAKHANKIYSGEWKPQGINPDYYASDGGSNCSRFFQQFHDPHPGFFYAPKASKSERNKGLQGMPERERYTFNHVGRDMTNPKNALGKVERARIERGESPTRPSANIHPCVKPLSLMRYLLRLVTPPGGTTLDCFAGSGTTGVAAISEGFNAILIEAEPEYCEIAERRCAHALSETRKNEVKTAREWGLENVHPQDMLLRYIPDERPEEGGIFEPVEESWEDKRTGPEPDDLTYREVVEKFATALAKTEEQFKDKLF